MESSSPSDTRHNPHGIDAILARRDRPGGGDRTVFRGATGPSLVTSASGRDCWHLLHHLHRQLQLAAVAATTTTTSSTANESSPMSMSSGSSETEVATTTSASKVLVGTAGN